jgi:hypothetical protein
MLAFRTRTLIWINPGEASSRRRRFAALERWARDRLPNLGEVTHRWSGQVLEPTDFIGFIGHSPDEDHVFVISGDSGLAALRQEWAHGRASCRLKATNRKASHEPLLHLVMARRIASQASLHDIRTHARRGWNDCHRCRTLCVNSKVSLAELRP